MKKILCYLCLNLLLTTIYTAIASSSQPLDSIVAIVNNQIITQSELQGRIIQAKQQLTQQHIHLPNTAIIQHQVLNALIAEKLQLQTAQRASITVSQQRLNQALIGIAQQRKMTMQQFFTSLKKSGVSQAKFLQQLHQQLMISELQKQAIAPRVHVKPSEIDIYLHSILASKNNLQYHVEDILIALPETPSPTQIKAAKIRAEKLITEIRGGANFQSLAVAQSSGQQALKGGDLGWRHLAELPTIFANQVGKMKLQQVAGPIRAANGFHVIRLAGIRHNKTIANKQRLRQQVGEMLFRRKFEQELQNWLRRTRSGAYIKIIKATK